MSRRGAPITWDSALSLSRANRSLSSANLPASVSDIENIPYILFLLPSWSFCFPICLFLEDNLSQALTSSNGQNTSAFVSLLRLLSINPPLWVPPLMALSLLLSFSGRFFLSCSSQKELSYWYKTTMQISEYLACGLCYPDFQKGTENWSTNQLEIFYLTRTQPKFI